MHFIVLNSRLLLLSHAIMTDVRSALPMMLAIRSFILFLVVIKVIYIVVILFCHNRRWHYLFLRLAFQKLTFLPSLRVRFLILIILLLIDLRQCTEP